MRAVLSSGVCTTTSADCRASAAEPIVNPLASCVPRRWRQTRDGLSVASWRISTSATAAMHAGTAMRTPSIEWVWSTESTDAAKCSVMRCSSSSSPSCWSYSIGVRHRHSASESTAPTLSPSGLGIGSTHVNVCWISAILRYCVLSTECDCTAVCVQSRSHSRSAETASASVDAACGCSRKSSGLYFGRS